MGLNASIANIKMKSKTLIEYQLQRKTNNNLVETIINAKKNSAWLEIASTLVGPRRKRIDMNLSQIDTQAKAGETIIIPGKVLSGGEVSKKFKIVAISFSAKAEEKLKKAGCEAVLISQEIERNKDAKGVKILK